MLTVPFTVGILTSRSLDDTSRWHVESLAECPQCGVLVTSGSEAGSPTRCDQCPLCKSTLCSAQDEVFERGALGRRGQIRRTRPGAWRTGRRWQRSGAFREMEVATAVPFQPAETGHFLPGQPQPRDVAVPAPRVRVRWSGDGRACAERPHGSKERRAPRKLGRQSRYWSPSRVGSAMVAQGPFKPEVVGSSPTRPTSPSVNDHPPASAHTT